MSSHDKDFRRKEPLFGLQTPLLFAHRGGVWEVPESTVEAFNHALHKARADVLELDVQLTRDGEFVVWHGPDLDNVKIKDQNDWPYRRDRTKIYHFDWAEIEPGKAWVADPEFKRVKLRERNLEQVRIDENRCLLRLSEFLEKFPRVPLNIEMKSSFRRRINDTDRRGLRDNIKAFSDILANYGGQREILVVSAHDDYIDEFRELNGSKYLTGLSAKEQLILRGCQIDMTRRALETPHYEFFASEHIIRKVRNLGGSTFVFLTGFGPLPAIDHDEKDLKEERIFEILERGVDGIMTDRPKSVRGMIDKWVRVKSSL